MKQQYHWKSWGHCGHQSRQDEEIFKMEELFQERLFAIYSKKKKKHLYDVTSQGQVVIISTSPTITVFAFRIC